MSMKNWIKQATLMCMLGLFVSVSGHSSRAVAAEDAADCPALKALEGTWKTDEADSLDATWVFKGEKVEVNVNGMEYKGKVKADDKAKPHQSLDIELTDGPDDVKGKTGKAIYKLDGEKLTISISHPGGDRPKEFETVPDDVYVFELKKKKA